MSYHFYASWIFILVQLVSVSVVVSMSVILYLRVYMSVIWCDIYVSTSVVCYDRPFHVSYLLWKMSQCELYVVKDVSRSVFCCDIFLHVSYLLWKMYPWQFSVVKDVSMTVVCVTDVSMTVLRVADVSMPIICCGRRLHDSCVLWQVSSCQLCTVIYASMSVIYCDRCLISMTVVCGEGCIYVHCRLW